MNRVEIHISATLVSVYMSDVSTDNNATFPNFRKIWEATIDLPFTRGYVHIGMRNNASVKYAGADEKNYVFYFDEFGFDGPTLDELAPRAYEVPDNDLEYTTAGDTTAVPPEAATIDVMELGYHISDGTDGTRNIEGLWTHDPWTHVGAVSFVGNVDLTGATAAKLTFTVTPIRAGTGAFDPITTSMGIKYRFNGGTWRTRLFTADEATAITATLVATLVVDVLLADLDDGVVNDVNFSAVGLHMGFPPCISNIDLLIEVA
jgi:hypothetical protein